LGDIKSGRIGNRLERGFDTRFLRCPQDFFQPSVGHAIVGLKAMQTRRANALQTLEITVHIRIDFRLNSIKSTCAAAIILAKHLLRH
jgi:hypothetical protein